MSSAPSEATQSPRQASPPMRLAVFDLRGAHRPQPLGAAGPLAKVCGLPILVRNLLVAQRAGLSRAVVLLYPEDRGPVERELARCSRLTLRLALRDDVGSSLAPALEDAEPDATEVVYWPGALSFGRFAPDWLCAPVAPEGALLGPQSAARRALRVASPGVAEADCGLAVLGARVVTDHAEEPAAELPGQLELAGVARRLPLGRPAHVVLDARARDAAEAELLVSLRKPVDGAVAKFDRYVSLAVSKQLMKLPVRPNQVTVAAGLLGVLCGLIAAQGGYFWMLLGAIGFQLNSIMDGIDGEIARAKLFESRLGQWLDTFADDSSNLAFSVGTCIGCYRTWGSSVYLVLAVIAGVGFIITACLMYHYIITVAHSGDLNDFKMPWEENAPAEAPAAAQKSGLSAVLARMKFVVRRDTFVFLCTIFAILGQLRVMAWLFAAGATSVWVAIVVYRVVIPVLRRRAGQGA